MPIFAAGSYARYPEGSNAEYPASSYPRYAADSNDKERESAGNYQNRLAEAQQEALEKQRYDMLMEELVNKRDAIQEYNRNGVDELMGSGNAKMKHIGSELAKVMEDHNSIRNTEWTEEKCESFRRIDDNIRRIKAQADEWDPRNWAEWTQERYRSSR